MYFLNTFFKNDKCVLIYDYEAVSCFWPEAEALAFTVHRFIREYIRFLKDRGGHEVEENITRAVNFFLEEYARGGMPIPHNFSANLRLEIKTTNLSKLLSIMLHN